MARCWCEGQCDICGIGDVYNHMCNHCNVEFCPVCHGTLSAVDYEYDAIVTPCECETEYLDE